MKSATRLRVTNKLGSCQDCTILSLALLGTSLLVMSFGGLMNLTIVVTLGIISSVAFALLLSLHALFFVLKRKKAIETKSHRSCCGS